jgi:hypothetical protein
MANPHPTIVFKIAAPIDFISYLHPDRHQTNQDTAISNEATRNSLRSTWLPGFLRSENIVLNNDDTFTAYGEKALYLKNNFTEGANKCLDIISNS